MIQSTVLTFIIFKNYQVNKTIKSILGFKVKFIANNVTDLNGKEIELKNFIHNKNSLIYLFSYNCNSCFEDDLQVLNTINDYKNLNVEKVIAICTGNYRMISRYVNLEELKIFIFADKPGSMIINNNIKYLPSLLYVSSTGDIKRLWKGGKVGLDIQFGQIEKFLMKEASSLN